VLADVDLSRAGVPARRARSIRELARAVNGGQIAFEGIVDCEAFLARFREIAGVDAWTAQYVSMRALGEPDAFPYEGLALQGADGSADALEQRSRSWRPWRAYAAMYLAMRAEGPLRTSADKPGDGRMSGIATSSRS